MIEITAAEIDAQVSAWIAANQTGKRRPSVARIAGALGYARLTVKASVERIERAVRAAAEPAAHRAYCRNHTLSCTCAEFGRDHVAPLEVFDAPPPAALAEVVTVTPVTETTAQSLALLEQITAEQDEQRETAVHMVDSMLTARGRTPESIAYVARHALRLMLAANPGDEITTLALAELDRRHPAACVTVEGETGTGLRWHLVDRDGNPVEAGEYTARDGDRFTIAQHPEVYFGTGTDPRTVAIQWQTISGKPRRKAQSGNDSCFVEILVDGWNWAAERV